MENQTNNNVRQKRCMGCMRMIPEESTSCPYCDYTANSAYDPKALEENTMLVNRYLIGRVLGLNGEDITYIGYDIEEKVTVKIREFFPDTICMRQQDSQQIKVFSGCETLYHKYKEEFIDLNRLIGTNADIKALIPATNLFEMNGTVYAVFIYADGIEFGDFLARNLGDLTWEQVRYLFVPFLKDLQAMHDIGIVHGGISPQTILINKEGNLRLTGFCTRRVRQKFGGATSQLYKGYAAPEQYTEGALIGRFTDVYGVAAVIYRAVTGTMPPESCTRVQADNLVDMSQLNSMIPKPASDAIAKAMSMDVAQRTRTISGLLDEIKDIRGTTDLDRVTQDVLQAQEQGEKPTEKEPVQPVKKTANTLSAKRVLEVKKKNDRKGPKYWFIAYGVTFVILGIIAVWVFISLYGEQMGFGRGDSSETSENPVSSVSSIVFDEKKLPSFVGQKADDLLNDAQYTDYIIFETKEDYNSQYSGGIVYKQDPSAKTTLTSGEKITVTLYVSKGEKTIRMPRVASLSLESARSALDELKIGYNEIMVYDESVPVGNVVRADYEVDDEINPKTDTVTLFVSAEIPKV